MRFEKSIHVFLFITMSNGYQKYFSNFLLIIHCAIIFRPIGVAIVFFVGIVVVAAVCGAGAGDDGSCGDAGGGGGGDGGGTSTLLL